MIPLDIEQLRGSLYWSSEDGTNNYLVRMDRFVRYTDLMEELDVQCAFGYPVLPNRIELVKAYYTELVRQGHLRYFDIEALMTLMKRIDDTDVKSFRRENMLRMILRKAIYKIAPLCNP